MSMHRRAGPGQENVQFVGSVIPTEMTESKLESDSALVEMTNSRRTELLCVSIDSALSFSRSSAPSAREQGKTGLFKIYVVQSEGHSTLLWKRRTRWPLSGCRKQFIPINVGRGR
jgi:hypothetical protein